MSKPARRTATSGAPNKNTTARPGFKVRDAFDLLQAIRECQQSVPGLPPVKFSYCLAKNARALQAEFDTIRAAVSEGIDQAAMQEWEGLRMQMLRERATKQPDGSPMVMRNPLTGAEQFVLPRGQQDIDELAAELREKCPAGERATTRYSERWEQLIEQPCEVSLHKLPIADWPNVPAALMERMLPISED
jgi:hypothetical protein